MKFQELLKELKKLNLPKGKYAIFGSGPLAIRKIRDSKDIDIIVKEDLFLGLLNKYPQDIEKHPTKSLIIKNLEIGNNWQGNYKIINRLIDEAEIIQDFPFVKLEEVIKWKEKMSRPKDIKDLELIKEYLENEKNTNLPRS